MWQPSAVADAVAAASAGVYAAAAVDVLDAFGPRAAFPGALAIGLHFVDYVAHGRDVAATIGSAFDLPADVLAAVLPIALGVPEDKDFRVAAGAAFGPAVMAATEANDPHRIVSHLGHSPDWVPTRENC